MTEVFDRDVTLSVRTVPAEGELPYTVNSVQVAGSSAVVEIKEGAKGIVGVEGEPAWPWTWQGDVANIAVLTALEPALGDEEAGFAWHIVDQNRIRLWTGSEWISFYDAFRHPGRQGPPNVLEIGTVGAGAIGSDATATLSDSSPTQKLNVTMPKGATGAQGELGVAGKILDASDVAVDPENPIGDGMVLMWNSTLGKFLPAANPAMRGPWAIGSGQINAGSNLKDAPRTLGTITVPPQPTEWRPMVLGSLSMQQHVRTLGAGRVDVEVRMGAVDGEVVGYGIGISAANWFVTRIFPKFEFPLTPTSDVGVIPANQTTTFYLVTRRANGTSNYSLNVDVAALIVWAMPVYPYPA